MFVTIPVQTSFMKTKLKSIMNQNRVNDLLTIGIEQKLARRINFDDVIESFKVPIEII